MASETVFDVETGPISAETAVVAEKELRETPERVTESTQRLRELLHAEKSITFSDDDDFLLIFLRNCKFYPESALELMKRISEFKKNNSDLLNGLLPAHVKSDFLDHDVVNILKDRDHKGRRVLIVNVGSKWDPKKVDANQLFRLFYMVHEAAMLEPETQVRGVVVIMDYAGMGMSQVKGLTPNFAMRLLSFIQDAMPVRLKEVHFINEPWVFKIVWQLFKPLIRPKLKGRIHFHKSSMESLHKFLTPTHIPKNYGGELPEVDYTGSVWFPVVERHIDHIHKWNSCGYVNK